MLLPYDWEGGYSFFHKECVRIMTRFGLEGNMMLVQFFMTMPHEDLLAQYGAQKACPKYGQVHVYHLINHE